MSGPQGYGPTQPWQPQPGQGDQGAEQQASGWQPPAYDYSQYQQSMTGYPAAPQYPQQYGQYAQPGQYPQPGQYAQPGQYGQYAQPGQYAQYPPPYGQPGQYAQYPAYGQPGPEAHKKNPRTLIVGVIGGLAALVVLLVLVTGFWLPGFFVTTKLDINKAQEGVQQILTDQTNGYGAKNVKDVTCNEGRGDPEVEKGGTFDCDVSIDGTKRKVTVTFQDDRGTYEVGRPK